MARNQPKSLIAVERRMRFIAVAALLASAAAFDNELEFELKRLKKEIQARRVRLGGRV